MLAAKVLRSASSWLSTAAQTGKSTTLGKAKGKKVPFSKYIKSRPLLAPRLSVRFVLTSEENVDDLEWKVPHVTDLRGYDQSVELLTGVPQAQLNRKVIIYRPTPRTTQSGSKHTLVYMKFERVNARTNESLMGWTATTDPTGNLTLSFPNDTAAVAFAQRNGLDYEIVVHEGQERIREPRDYAVNFKFKNPKKEHSDSFDL
jgi:hypothetical protein